MARTGLVLGAGGIVGQAHHAGVLAALEDQLGWDPRTADVIVGTSAGSVTGSVLRLGASAADIAAFIREEPLTADGAALFDLLAPEAIELPPFAARGLLRPWRMPSPRLVARVLRRPWAFRPSVAAMTMLPAGQVDLSTHTAVLDHLDDPDGAWPDGLLVCAARRDDGARVVFGRPGAPPASLSQAVAASCAIPGYFGPVAIEGVEYFDGGVHSPTNADILAGAELDVVVVVSPLSAAHGRARTPDAVVRYSAHRRLARELRRLRASGTEVICFEPGARALASMGVNAMADDRSSAVVDAAYTEARRRAADPRLDGRIALLTGQGDADVAA